MPTYKDLKAGDCWRFLVGGDKVPTYTYDDRIGSPPKDRPDEWDYDDLPDYPEWMDQPVVMMEHYSDYPEGIDRPIYFIVVPTHEVAKGMWCVGTWSNRGAAENVAMEANDDIHHLDNCYRGSVKVGPLDEDGWVVVDRADWRRLVRKEAPVLAQPSGEVAVLGASKSGDLTGWGCLRRYELAMQAESMAKVGDGYVSTHGEHALDAAQTELARRMWALVLADKVAEQKRKEQLRVVVDPECVDG